MFQEPLAPSYFFRCDLSTAINRGHQMMPPGTVTMKIPKCKGARYASDFMLDLTFLSPGHKAGESADFEVSEGEGSGVQAHVGL